MQRKFIAGLILGVTLAAGFAYQLLYSPELLEYRGFTALKWAKHSGCSDISTNVANFPMVRRTVTWNPGNPIHQAECVSEWIQPEGNVVELEYAGLVDHSQVSKVHISFETKSGEVVKRKFMPQGEPRGIWWLTAALLERPDQSPIRVRVTDAATVMGWTSVRARVNFYDAPAALLKLQNQLKKSRYNRYVPVLLSLGMALCVLVLLPRAGTAARFALYFASTFVVHFRWGSFFFIDDWQYLERISEHGIGSIFLTQNEHFIPIFSALFYGQLKLFADNYTAYVLINLLLHAGNGLLLEALLRRLMGARPESETIARVLAYLYIICGLHAQVLQWLTCQSTVLAMGLRFACMICAWDYLKTGRRSKLWGALAAGIVGPLVFGGNFSLAIELPALFLILWYAAGRRGEGAEVLRPAIFWRSFRLLSILAFAFLAEVLLYFNFQRGSGVFLHEAQMPGVWDAVRYVLLGSQYGTIVRGISISNPVRYSTIADFVADVMPEGVPQDIYLSALGAMLNLLLLLYYLRRRDERLERLAFWIFGQVIILLPFLLTLFNRLRWGVGYAFQLRYYTVTMFGLAVLLVPLCMDLRRWWLARRSERSYQWRGAVGAAASLLLVFHIYRSTNMSSQYMECILEGHRERIYYDQLHDWNQRLGRKPGDKTVSFEGAGSEYAGLYPLFYKKDAGFPLTAAQPKRDPDVIYTLISRHR